MLDSAPTYTSLITKSMVLGIPSDSFIVLIGCTIIFFGIVGFSLVKVVGAMVVFVVTLPFLRRMFEKEPLSVELAGAYLLQWPDHLPHHSRVDKFPRADVVPKGEYS